MLAPRQASFRPTARERAESSLYSLYPNKRQRSRRYIYSSVSVFGLRQSLVLFTSLLATATTRFTHDKLALTRSRGLQCRGLQRWGRRPAGQEGRRCTINHLSSLSYFYYERHGRNTVCNVHPPINTVRLRGLRLRRLRRQGWRRRGWRRAGR